MTSRIDPISETGEIDAAHALPELSSRTEPLVLRGLARDWPLVKRSSSTLADINRYLLDFYNGKPVTAFIGDEHSEGRIFYSDDLAKTNFRQISTQLDDVLSRLEQHERDATPPTIYMGSTPLNYCLPGFSESNSLDAGNLKPTVRIWLGNRTRVAAHYDVMQNVACVCAGRRRFTLFPPDQLANLYVGPLDFTPAGQPVSLVDLNDPDLERYPRFAEALEHARTAVLEPGDAIFIPSMWWHSIEGLESYNILINHWWRESPAYLGAPGDALLHAILSIRDLPAEQRAAWRHLFEHYVFDAQSGAFEHIPDGSKGVLDALDENAARRLRTLLRNNLNR